MSKEWTQEDIISLLRDGVIKFETREDSDGALVVTIWLGPGLEDAIREHAHALHWYLTHVTPLSS